MESCFTQGNSCGVYLRDSEYSLGFPMSPNPQVTYPSRDFMGATGTPIVNSGQGSYNLPPFSSSNQPLSNAPLAPVSFPMPFQTPFPQPAYPFMGNLMPYPYFCPSQNFAVYRSSEEAYVPFPVAGESRFTSSYTSSPVLDLSRESPQGCANAAPVKPKVLKTLADEKISIPNIFKPFSSSSASGILFK